MFRPTVRTALQTQRTASSSLRAQSYRHISTQPPHLRSRSWKSSALRWGIAAAGIYYYNTSPVFAEQPHHNLLNPNVEPVDESETASVLDELTSRRSREAQKNHELVAENATGGLQPEPAVEGGAAELEEEAAGEGAFNPETGEINWDCPCLGGMAHGPCGPQFREAFSCFVFSKEEPKGMDCIEKFQGMRDCFQEHPDVYAAELMEDEELDRELEAEKQDLVNQIAERRKADEAASTHNLLEEPAPFTPPKEPSQPRQTESTSVNRSVDQPSSSRNTPPTKSALSSQSDQPQSGSKTRSSADGQHDPERENVHEGQKSQAVRQPKPPPVRSDAEPETDGLIPKAAHDARSSIGPGGEPPKDK